VMNAQLSEQIATGASVFPSDHRGPSGAHPGPRTMDPGGPRDSYPPVPGSGPQVLNDGSFADPQRAANLMSPVGQQYPGQVDWEAAAAASARAVPPWLLALLFLGAIGIALGLTIAIAKLVA
jgi:hypothetical protein